MLILVSQIYIDDYDNTAESGTGFYLPHIHSHTHTHTHILLPDIHSPNFFLWTSAKMGASSELGVFANCHHCCTKSAARVEINIHNAQGNLLLLHFCCGRAKRKCSQLFHLSVSNTSEDKVSPMLMTLTPYISQCVTFLTFHSEKCMCV